MRNTALALLVLAACGSGKKHDDAGTTGGSDSSNLPTADAPPLQACTPTSGTTPSLRRIGGVQGSAVLATSPPNDGRLFVVEQAGRIRIFENDVLKPTPFLDVTGVAHFVEGGEQGLLGLAFHPNYASNNLFYVFYTTGGCPGANCANVVARYTASTADLNVADPASGTEILRIPDFATNHNGGMMEFGADGFLYIGTGDGGGGGDPNRNAQNTNALLAKINRLDVDHPANGKNYGIPSTNPYAGGGGEPEILIRGVRNPWRFSFDSMTGDLWIGDVGQDTDEELDMIPAGQQNGKNMGWSMYEANRCFGNYTCDPAGITFPQATWNQNTDGWMAIIGGQVYRGPCYPDLQGYYFFTDNTAHLLARAQADGAGNVTVVTQGAAPGGPSSFHADARGELYMTTTNGSVYHLEAGP
jgi:hypothetical protein